MKENYIYPAIFSKGEEGETEIRFVDFPDILTYSETLWIMKQRKENFLSHRQI